MNRIPVLKPLLPVLGDLHSLIGSVDNQRKYTNHGPLEKQLREDFSRAFGRKSGQSIGLFSSGTTAMIACMRSWGLPPGARCLVPSWTFIGTVCAVIQAGLEPVFIDIDSSTWSPRSDFIAEAFSEHNAHAAVIVAPFGAEVAYEDLARMSKTLNKKILIDAAAAFDMVQQLSHSDLELSG